MSSIDEFRKYKFEEDEEFNQFLSNIGISPDPSESQKERLLLEAKIFFFRKKTGSLLTVDEYLKTQSPTTKQAEEPVLTFAEIKHLIETGQAHLIPNNKVIPDKINDETPSRSIAPT